MMLGSECCYDLSDTIECFPLAVRIPRSVIVDIEPEAFLLRIRVYVM